VLPVEIHPIQDALVLRARGSELLILADHVTELKKLKSAGDFSRYFLQEALVNRPARKLFEAWLRKDGSLWARIYKTVQTIETSTTSEPPKQNPAKQETTPVKPTKLAESVKEKEEVKKSAKKSETKSKTATKTDSDADSKHAATKSNKKATTSVAKSESKKSGTKTAVKSATKSAAKPASKTTAKPAAKSAAKKSSKK